jgi:hypothetical protein
MNRSELESTIARYLHRTDLTTDIPGFIELATARLGRDLRSDWNFVVSEVAISAVPYQLPEDFRELRAITTPEGAGTLQLRSMPTHEYNKVSGSSTPAWYRITGRGLDIVPFQARNYTLEYWGTPASLELGSSTNAVLTYYPFLYVYACLFEGAIFLQDAVMEAKYRDVYQGEVSLVNAESAQRRMGDAPTMRAI